MRIMLDECQSDRPSLPSSFRRYTLQSHTQPGLRCHRPAAASPQRDQGWECGAADLDRTRGGCIGAKWLPCPRLTN